MRIISFLLSLTLAVFILGCSPKQTDKQPDEKLNGVLTDAQKKTLEKANKVDDLLKETNEKHLKEIDEMK